MTGKPVSQSRCFPVTKCFPSHDRSLGYYTYGVVPVDGEITFSVTMAYATANSKWAFTHTGGTVPYMYVLLIGCNQGQAVDYGTVTYVPADGGSGFNVLPENQWTITDSNFPIPL